MKQVAQNYRSGELTVLDVPRPACKPGGVLVRSLFSLISTGTEMMKISEANLSMLGMARARPDQVKKVFDSVSQQGAVATYKKVVNRLDSYTPLGYSLAGVVVEIGAGVSEFSVGQVVAAAGNEFALHADYNWIPVNLCVPVPDGVPPEQAAFATVGAIAMHGVRRGDVQLGETALVIGLGLIGQLVVRLLIAAGVRVIGTDVVDSRCRLAEKAGALACAAPTPEGVATLERIVTEGTGGLGADHVFLAAGGSSNEPVELAARLARDRARIVDIGKTKLDLPWNSYYDKELDVRFSRSYGPGRYDDRYELEGIDYPAGYVRWTERRNLACFLDLLAGDRLDVSPLIDGMFPVTEATDVYSRLSSGELRGIGFLFEYDDADPAAASQLVTVPQAAGLSDSPAQTPSRRRPSTAPIRIGFIGAGNYASTMLLPHLAKLDGVQLAHVATTTALSAANAQRRFGFATMSTDADALLSDESIDAVFVVTRHHAHARQVCTALEHGKAVFVEKPLALSMTELEQIRETVEITGNRRLMVGFNRRFAPMLTDLHDQFTGATGPTKLRYLVNAGPLDARSWYRQAELEGSRFAGEGGHFIDTVSWWIGCDPLRVQAVGSDDEVCAQLEFPDGSIAQLSYVTTGNSRFPKETLDVAADGRSGRMDNFRRTDLWSGRRHRRRRAQGGQDKGQAAALRAFVDAVRSDSDMPIPLPSLLATTATTLAIERSIASRQPECP